MFGTIWTGGHGSGRLGYYYGYHIGLRQWFVISGPWDLYLCDSREYFAELQLEDKRNCRDIIINYFHCVIAFLLWVFSLHEHFLLVIGDELLSQFRQRFLLYFWPEGIYIYTEIIL